MPCDVPIEINDIERREQGDYPDKEEYDSQQ
jgi:hypothetical protein